MPSLYFMPFRPAYDSAGISVPGAQHWFTLADGVTPASVYQDEELTVEHTNPVVADGAGKLEAVYLDDAVDYRVRIYARNAEVGIDTPLEDYDPYLPGSVVFGDMATIFGRVVAMSGNAAVNAARLSSAVAAANGNPVIIRANANFLCDETTITNTPIDLRFEGPGRWDISGGQSGLIVENTYDNLRAVSAITRTTLTVEGESCAVDRLTIASDGTYQRGSIVKVFSDDIDPYASASTARRVGEFAVVVDVAPGYIYVAPLKDGASYVTNARVARLPQRACNISGLKMLSANTNGSVAVQLNAPFRPKVDIDILNHGQIVLNLGGSYEGEFRVTGTGFTNSADVLGYLVNDSNGQDNRFWLNGARFRHVYTSNHNGTAAGEAEPRKYGRTRRPWVTGVSEQTWGAAWDTHQGCEDVTFENCTALGAMSGFDNAAAFQLRGINGSIINGKEDGSFPQSVRLVAYTGTTGTQGTVRIINPDFRSVRALSGPDLATGDTTPTIIWSGGLVRANGFSSTLFDIGKAILRVTDGARIVGTNISASDSNIFQVYDVGELHTCPSTSVEVSGTAIDFQLVRGAGTGGKWVGGVRIRHSGLTWTAIFDDDATAPFSTMVFKAVIEKGAMITPTSGSFAYRRYAVHCVDDVAASATNVTDYADYAKTIGAF